MGPKVNALQIWPQNSDSPVVPIKVKGITLTDSALDVIKLESMIKLAEDFISKNGNLEECDKLEISQMQIRPTKLQTIETMYLIKKLRVMSDKRRLKGNDTLPYGFVE